MLYPSHGQHALPNCVPSRVATLPPRDLSACFSYASLGHSHQTSLEPQTTRRAMVQQVNPSIMSIQNLLTPRVIPTSSAPHEQQRDVNQISALFPIGIQMTVPDQHMSIPLAVNVPHTMMPALQPARSTRIEKLSFPYLKSDDPQVFAMLDMALRNLLPPEKTEHYKYHILLDHLKLDAAQHLPLAYAHHSQPYTTSLKALQK